MVAGGYEQPGNRNSAVRCYFPHDGELKRVDVPADLLEVGPSVPEALAAFRMLAASAMPLDTPEAVGAVHPNPSPVPSVEVHLAD
jgi:hypothetical protein